MMDLISQFASAIILFDFCSGGIEESERNKRISDLPLVQWRLMAGRDAGMSIYHFGKTIETVRQFANKSPWLCEQIDLQVVREAKRSMNDSFPGWEDARHAISHRADFFIDPGQSWKHRVAVNQSVTETYWNRLQGRTFTHTVNSKHVNCEVSEASLQKMIVIRRKFFSAFKNQDHE